MNIRLCDYCMKAINENDTLMITVSITPKLVRGFGGGVLDAPFNGVDVVPLPFPMPLSRTESKHFDMCIECAKGKGLVETETTVKAIVGQLTPEEIEKIEKGTF
jgi:hypothetical protein